MQELLQDINLLYLVILFFAGIISFTISTVSGGGGALILVPLVNFMLGTIKTAPIINLGTFIGRPARLILFWKYINWSVFLYYVPAAMAGAWVAGWFFTKAESSWLQILVGIFLISTVFQYRFGKKERSFPVKLWFFIPLGFIVSILGTIVGGLGPVLNPFYLNLGLDKEELIATKTVNSFFLGISQIGSYAFFGLLHNELWIYGIALGLGTIIGNIIGKKFLSKMKNSNFRKLLIFFMVLSGILMIYNQLK
ncbi:sulfite exporter TauE/SafE family protein [Christiangramia sabulilitoris]|uniref:Probable membrane transporter protein n=1 Tax=Christiangramia sabulilitoris TaxID=2583991 RepID=A0A550I6F3_9FLAO|nr:sulfite exporter TauE/SafE family protein [Christiangramia sabulilitoris]TRO66388.1 sulfite exporter TauE/SafE family protein [Christiangramia sabulilitoris]